MNELKKYNWMVCVHCATYNHAPYIEDAMNGFCIQKTTFPFVCVIVDDASTDKECEVINDYMIEHFEHTDITQIMEETEDYVMTFAQHKDNKNCFFAFHQLKYNHGSIKKSRVPYYTKWDNNAKYIARCEGDDYWIDSLKLQKQVDYMDNHPGHSLCFCSHKNLYPSGEIQIETRYDADMDECPMADIILGGGTYMATNSMLYSWSLYKQHDSSWAIGCPIGDVPLMLTLANNGKVAFLNDVMCVYRITSNGSWTSKMEQSFKLRWNHNRKIIRMWHQFDEWSNRKYHSLVCKKIRNNNEEIFKDAVLTLARKVKSCCNI